MFMFLINSRTEALKDWETEEAGWHETNEAAPSYLKWTCYACPYSLCCSYAVTVVEV